MVTISPKTVALAGLALLAVGVVTALLAASVDPSAPPGNLILLAGTSVLIIGYLGVLFAYYYVGVNAWDAGNPAGAVLFIVGPPVVAQIFVTLSAVIPLGAGDIVYLATFVATFLVVYPISGIGLLPILLAVILAAAALFLGVVAKRALKRHLLHLPDPDHVTAPGTPVLVASAVLLTVFLYGSAALLG